MNNETKQEWINEIRFKLGAYDGSYSFIPEDELEVRTSGYNNDYPVYRVFRKGDDVTIGIITEWGEYAEVDANMFTTNSLEKIFDAIEPPLSLFVTDSNDNTIFAKEFSIRIIGKDDALDELKSIFNLDWEFIGNEKENVWMWEYKQEGKQTLVASFE